MAGSRGAVRSSARLSTGGGNAAATAAAASEARAAARSAEAAAAAARRRARAAERTREVEDSPQELREKCKLLADALRNAKHLVVYTGAGISTAADIPDYRGPRGVWTRLRRGETVGRVEVSSARPTLTHMALTALYARGTLKFVVSQNCDGLHLRSGLPRRALAELHGDMFAERCGSCRRVYLRAFDTTERTARHAHGTRRLCHRCGAELTDTIVHFGERGRARWPLNWAGALRHAARADVVLCLGSSLKVLRRYPRLWRMQRSPASRPALYIVNLQWTPKDAVAALKINARCDAVMAQVARRLALFVPRYCERLDPLLSHAVPLAPAEQHTTRRPLLPPPPPSLLDVPYYYEESSLSSGDSDDELPLRRLAERMRAVPSPSQSPRQKCVSPRLGSQEIDIPMDLPLKRLAERIRAIPPENYCKSQHLGSQVLDKSIDLPLRRLAGKMRDIPSENFCDSPHLKSQELNKSTELSLRRLAGKTRLIPSKNDCDSLNLGSQEHDKLMDLPLRRLSRKIRSIPSENDNHSPNLGSREHDKPVDLPLRRLAGITRSIPSENDCESPNLGSQEHDKLMDLPLRRLAERIRPITSENYCDSPHSGSQELDKSINLPMRRLAGKTKAIPSENDRDSPHIRSQKLEKSMDLPLKRLAERMRAIPAAPLEKCLDACGSQILQFQENNKSDLSQCPGLANSPHQRDSPCLKSPDHEKSTLERSVGPSQSPRLIKPPDRGKLLDQVPRLSKLSDLNQCPRLVNPPDDGKSSNLCQSSKIPDLTTAANLNQCPRLTKPPDLSLSPLLAKSTELSTSQSPRLVRSPLEISTACRIPTQPPRPPPPQRLPPPPDLLHAFQVNMCSGDATILLRAHHAPSVRPPAPLTPLTSPRRLSDLRMFRMAKRPNITNGISLQIGLRTSIPSCHINGRVSKEDSVKRESDIVDVKQDGGVKIERDGLKQELRCGVSILRPVPFVLPRTEPMEVDVKPKTLYSKMSMKSEEEREASALAAAIIARAVMLCRAQLYPGLHTILAPPPAAPPAPRAPPPRAQCAWCARHYAVRRCQWYGPPPADVITGRVYRRRRYLCACCGGDRGGGGTAGDEDGGGWYGKGYRKGRRRRR